MASVNPRHRTRCAPVIALLAVLLFGSMALAPATAERAGASATDRDRIARLYQAYFMRTADAGGAVYWTGMASRGMPVTAISQHFSRSPEFTRRYGHLDDVGFVRLVYRNVLGREPEVSGAAYWRAQLSAGLDRGGLMLLFSDSPEFQASLARRAPLEVVGQPQLRFAPPALSDPITIDVSSRPRTIVLEDGKDYRLRMPSEPVTKGMAIRGGRNVVLIGGHISIPWQGPDPTKEQRRALLLRGQTGTVHVEGLLIDGEDVSEGIQIWAPDARVQLQNIRIEGLRARDQVTFSDNHPDVVQPWGGVRELLVDRLTGETDYQGLFLPEDDGPIGRVELHRVNILGGPTSRYLLWASTDYPMVVDEVYARPAPGRSWDKTVWKVPEWGNARAGVPATGDFVQRGSVGIGYASPGYGT